MKNTIRFSVCVAAMSAVIAHAGTFKLTITNTGPQPLSPLFYSAGDATFDIFKVGSAASAGIKNIAERGNTTAMNSIASAAGSAVGTYGVLGGSPLAPGDSRTTTFTADAAHPYFSFAAMLGKTNDGFIGESMSSMGLMLSSTPIDLVISGARAWDAGTELNTQNAADLGFLGGSGNPAEMAGDDHVRVHAGIIPGVGDGWAAMPAWSSTTPLARVQVEAVPEPQTIFAVAMGTIMLIKRRKRA